MPFCPSQELFRGDCALKTRNTIDVMLSSAQHRVVQTVTKVEILRLMPHQNDIAAPSLGRSRVNERKTT